jgi:hypothetical protein
MINLTNIRILLLFGLLVTLSSCQLYRAPTGKYLGWSFNTDSLSPHNASAPVGESALNKNSTVRVYERWEMY